MCVRTFSQQMHTLLTYVPSGEFCRELCGRSEDANGHPAVLPSQTNGAFRGTYRTYVLYCNVLYLHSVRPFVSVRQSVLSFFTSSYLSAFVCMSVCFSFSFFLSFSFSLSQCLSIFFYVTRTHALFPSHFPAYFSHLYILVIST